MKELIELLKSVNPNIDYENEKHLISDGIIDSLTFVMIFSSISEHYNITVPFNDMTPENFNSVEAIKKLIDKIACRG